ncbi:aldo/keto reductase [Flavobacteriaceae bacterium]|nr:aldo/keto reductase [Flavobacteriaceae bacterium]
MKLVLGTVQFGLNYGINNQQGKPSDSSVKSILDKAYTTGITLLDTAEAYGDAQERIGLYHNKYGNKFKVITKFSSSVKNLPSNISDRVLNNIKILNIDSLYCYMFHSFNDFNNYFYEFEKDLCLLKNNGFIQKMGISLQTNEEFEKILEFDNIDLIQIPFNLLDNSNKRNEILIKAKQKGIEVHTRSVFLQGLIFKNPSDKNPIVKSLKSELEILNRIANKSNCSMEELALSYCLHQKNINNIIIGVDSINQLNDNVKAASYNICEDDIKVINNINVKDLDLLNPSLWK